MDPVVKRQLKNLGIYIVVKFGLFFGVRYALRKYLENHIASQELQAP